ncbi:MAG TPA: HAMP domain-containing sensor histidine kinase [Ktedonobacteraceae bacterium]|nr:HAMP domain-containing sensor histidine kinase [Ktedonobacteraceae bacterium]
MQAHKVSPVALLNLSSKVRILIIVLSYPLSMTIHALIFPTTRNGTATAIPVILAAWLFGYTGVFIWICVSACVVACVNIFVLHIALWLPANLLTYVTCFLASLVVGLIVSYLRYAVVTLERERIKALQAEQERSIAYEQRIEALQASKQMERAYEQQLRLHQMKDQFILNVNHELRTPLTEVYGYLELVTLSRGHLDDTTQETFLRRAMEGCEELTYLINNVTDALNIHSEEMHLQLEKISVKPVIQKMLDSFDPRLKERFNIRIDMPEQLAIWANQHSLRQVLRNLLSNAFKYSPEHTSITIHAEEDTERHVCICVQDEGPGIPASEKQAIFERFVRLKRDLSGAVRGMGLGLYISKQLVETMGGRIWAESTGQPGEGTRFYFTLYSAACSLADLAKQGLNVFWGEDVSVRDGEHVVALLAGMDERRDE